MAYQIDWNKHNNRTDADKRTDILTQCFHSQITTAHTARILFAAGFNVKAEVVGKFFAGRQKWLDSKKAEKQMAAQVAAQAQCQGTNPAVAA